MLVPIRQIHGSLTGATNQFEQLIRALAAVGRIPEFTIIHQPTDLAQRLDVFSNLLGW